MIGELWPGEIELSKPGVLYNFNDRDRRSGRMRRNLDRREFGVYIDFCCGGTEGHVGALYYTFLMPPGSTPREILRMAGTLKALLKVAGEWRTR